MGNGERMGQVSEALGLTGIAASPVDDKEARLAWKLDARQRLSVARRVWRDGDDGDAQIARTAIAACQAIIMLAADQEEGTSYLLTHAMNTLNQEAINSVQRLIDVGVVRLRAAGGNLQSVIDAANLEVYGPPQKEAVED